MMEKEKQKLAITESLVTSKIYIVRDKKVMPDRLEKTTKETPSGRFRWTMPTPELFDHLANLNGPVIARIN